jgi:hypothetical protein
MKNKARMIPAAIAANKIQLAFWSVSSAESIVDGWRCFGSGGGKGGGWVRRDGFGVDFNLDCLILGTELEPLGRYESDLTSIVH